MGNFELFLQRFWVNYQKQGEFNPYHEHGGIYSFSIWMQIPTDWRDQHNLSFLDEVNETQKQVSNF